MAVLALVADPTAVIVFAPGRTAFDAVAAADGSLLTSGSGFVTATAEQPGFVRRLYRSGAWFVWPVLERGCFASRA